jgi:Ca-activated chloride channel family protein
MTSKFFISRVGSPALAAVLITVLICLPAAGQSGRNKKPGLPEKPQKGQPAQSPPATVAGKPTPTPTPTNTPSPDDNSGDEVIRVAANLVSIPTSVVDTGGKTVDDLKLEDFQLEVDGQNRTIAELVRADTPVRMALLFDNSSSVSNAREFEKQAATRFFRRVLRKQDQAAIYTVSTSTTLIQSLTGDTKSLVQAIDGIGKPEGATAILDGVVMAADYLVRKPGRRVIVIVSDGDDTSSDIRFEDAVQIAQAADCQIYVVQTTKIENEARTGNANGSANLRALQAERRMEEFALQTGGTVYAPYSVKDLDPAFTQIAADLASQYILSYYPQDEKYDGRFRQLTVRVANRNDVRVRARKGYYTPRS